MREYSGLWHPSERPDQDSMMVQFYTDTVLDRAAMAEAMETEGDNRLIFKSTAKARLMTRADNKTGWDLEVERKPELKARFRTAWEAFERGAVDEIQGTPLTEWPEITRAVAMNLNQLGFITVEDIASVPDEAVRSIGQDGQALRDRARSYIQPKDKAVTEMEKTILDQRQQIENLKAQVQNILNMERAPAVDADVDKTPKRRGRPPKKEAA